MSERQATGGVYGDRRSLLDAILAEEGLGASPAARIPRRPTVSPIPLSFAQQRLWFLDQLAPGTPLYNIDMNMRLPFPVDVVALERALNEIVRRHEALRTTFRSDNGQPVQVVAPASPVTLPTVDLSAMDASQREVHATWVAGQDSARPFDLVAGPLFRALLIRLDDDDFVLTLTLHHIVSDGWSMNVLSTELGQLYDAFAHGESSRLEPLPLQSGDYAVWEREQWHGEHAQQHLRYWREQLAHLPACELLTDYPRQRVQSSAGATQGRLLSPALSMQIRELAAREGATLFMTTLAAFVVLLHRYTGQHDIVVGSPVAGRTRPELERLIGFFVNNIVLRTSADGNPTFVELLHRVQATVAGAFAHQDAPFEKLVEMLQPARDTTRTPLFQIMFALQDEASIDWSADGSFWQHGAPRTGTAKFELTLSVLASADAIAITAEYATDLFEHATIQRLLRRLQVLLEQAVANPERRISGFSLIDQDEWQGLEQWNATTADFSRTDTVDDCVLRVAMEHGERLAVSDRGRTLSYFDLAAQARRLAATLQTRGVGPDVVVPVIIGRSLELVVAELAVLLTGAAYAPFDPGALNERLTGVLRQVGGPVLLTVSDWPGVERFESSTMLLVDEWMRSAADDSLPEIVARPGDPARPAYVIFTSGSTGVPKGVVISHRSLMNLVCWHQHAYQVTPEDRATLLASPAFDASVWELWPYLASGASVHVIPNDVRDDPDALWRAIAESRITLAFFPTSLAEAALERVPQASLALRALLVGGDRLHAAPMATPFAVFNHYGPTENTVVSTWARLASDGSAAPPIGRAINNVRVYVLDSSRSPVPVGLPGELYVAGEGLAIGYLRDPERTTASFIRSPIDPSGRLYATGDLVRFREGGQLEFMGRLDQQLKIRGYRIEPAEIENALRQLPVCGDAAVVAHAFDAGELRLVAYVVPRDGAPLDEKAMQHHLQRYLPDYMVPKLFVAIDALPLSPNGKVDRQRLARITHTDTAPISPPRTELEQRISDIWRQLLGLEDVSTNANFFDVGGHSLLLVKLQTRMRAAFNRPIAIADLFQHPTVAAQAEWLVDQSPGEALGQEARRRAEQQRDVIARRLETRRRVKVADV